MIYPGDVESKDFSVALPGLVRKLAALGQAMVRAECHSCLSYDSKGIVGFGLLVQDVCDDLKQITGALYPDEIETAFGAEGEKQS